MQEFWNMLDYRIIVVWQFANINPFVPNAPFLYSLKTHWEQMD